MSGDTIARWRVKHPVIEAVQWTGDNIGDVFELAGCTNFDSVDAVDAANSDDPDATAQLLETVHSTWVPVGDGDWIVRGVTGLLFAVSDEKFRGDYEPEDAPPPVDRDALEQLAAERDRYRTALEQVVTEERMLGNARRIARKALEATQ